MKIGSKVFSLSSLLLTLVFGLLFVEYFHTISAINQDLGRHLKTGEIILATKQIPTINLYSYTHPSFPFINHHWLSEVIFFTLTRLTGFPGLLMFMVTLTLAGWVFLIRKALSSASAVSITLAMLLFISILSERTDLRPELFSFFFLSVYLSILFTYRNNFTRWLYLIPLIQLLWVNTHIYYFIGLFVLGLFYLDFLFLNRKKPFSRSVKIFTGITLLSGLSTLINPHGLKGAIYPLFIFNNYGYSIQENQTVFFLQNLHPKESISFFYLSVFIVMMTFLISIKKTRLIDWLLLITFTILGAMAIRNIPLFAITVFIPFTTHLTSILHLCFQNVTKKWRTHLYYGTYLLIVALIGSSIFQVLQKGTGGAHLPSGGEKAVTFFLTNNLHGPIFNNFDIGSYLAYRFYPQERVFVDGRPEAYPANFLQHVYIPMQQDPSLFSHVAKQYGFNAIIFSHTDQTPWAEAFLEHITKDSAWKIVYLDEMMIILLPSSSTLPAVTSATITQPSLQAYLQVAHFYSIVSWNSQLEDALKKILFYDPNHCTALKLLTLLLNTRNDPGFQVYLQRYQQTCSTLIQ